MLFWVFQEKTRQMLKCRCPEHFGSFGAPVPSTPSAPYRRERACATNKAEQTRRIHLTPGDLFSKLPPSFHTFCYQGLQTNDLAKILPSQNHNYVNPFFKAFF